MAKCSRLAWVALNILFFLFMTRTEFPALGRFAGLSYSLRILAGAAIILHFSLILGHGIKVKHVVASLIFASVFLFSNLSDGTMFALIACFCLLVGLFFGGMAQSNEAAYTLLSLTRVYVAVNVFGLLLGVVSYFGLGLEIDFHQLMFPWSAARVQEFMGFFRVTGFQIEPGTYTATVYFCALVSGALRGRLFGRIESVAVASTLFTLSAWSILAVTSYFIGCLVDYVMSIDRGGRAAKALAATLATVPVFGVILVLDFESTAFFQYFLDRFTVEDASGSMVMKIQAWDAFTSQFNGGMILPKPLSISFCQTCSSPQDLGTLINFVWFLGLAIAIPFLAVLSIRAFRAAGLGLLICSLPLVVAKFYFFDPSLWLYFGILLFYGGAMPEAYKYYASRLEHGQY
ncbi:hypothetical protein [Salipiger mucosus]|uniref:hypothetical protein n=1 Tax=Salipiger mucosus TaxID=263378 RepID=UPI0012EB0780|nr:hypothetical protein [Salipiger mucosus]